MAEKKVELGIILRTVDKATAGIKAINEKLDQLTKPARDFGKALKELGEKSGFTKVTEGFHEVGKASKEVFKHVLEGAAIIGETTHLVLEMIEGFSTLNDTAERIGVSVDALAGLRYAASKSGSSVEKLDQGLTTFVENLGGVKAGTGKLTKFLGEVAPTMLTQLKATRTTEEALGILADGMEKLTNKSKQLKFAQEVFGDPSLAVFAHRGSKGIMELMAAYAQMAGPQQEAAERAGKVDDALKDLHAATDGAKAALVMGLSPAFTEIIDKLRVWLVGHREDIARWAEDIGKRLPAAVDEVVKTVREAFGDVTGFVDSIGGWKVALAGVAAVMVGPLISAIASVSVALLATPFGWVLVSIAAIVLAIDQVIKHWDDLKSALDPTDRRSGAGAFTDAIMKLPGMTLTDDERANRSGLALVRAIPGAMPPEPGALPAINIPLVSGGQAGGAVAGQQQAKVTIDIKGAPPGTRATLDPRSTADVDLSVGHYMAGGGW